MRSERNEFDVLGRADIVFVIESSKNSQQLAAAIEGNSSLASDRGLLLVTDLTDRGYAVIGKVNDGDLHFLMKRR